MRFTLKDFEEWLKERGYDKMMGKENLEIYLGLGFSSLLFNNSNLLISFILNKLGLPTEKFSEKIRFEVGKRVKYIKATKDTLEIEI